MLKCKWIAGFPTRLGRLLPGPALRFLTLTFLPVVFLLVTFLVPARSALGEPLTLRVSDTLGQPGERVAVVLRTYAPRALSQGQVCLRARAPQPQAGGVDKGVSGPFSELEEVLVFSDQDDAGAVGTFEVGSQTALLELFSPSGTINNSDGPMAVFFFRLRPDLEPGTLIELEILAADTTLVDAMGEPVVLELRSGELDIRSPGAPRILEMDGADAAPGEITLVSVGTSEVFPMAAGQATLRFDSALFQSLVSVRMDPRHGLAFWNVDSSEPGRVTVSFSSPDLSLNSVPGEIIQMEFLTSSGLEVGTFWPLTLDPAGTWIEGEDGNLQALEFSADGIQVIPSEVLFADGFESQDLSAWSAVSP